MSEQDKAGAKPVASADPKSDAKRQAALQGALTQIERQFGKGAVMRMGDPGARVAVDAIPTGALSLDIALGIGGVPRGRIIEIFGPESSGKTTLVYHILAEAQKLGGVCAFVDAEHAMDPLYAQRIGVDIDELLVSQPDYGEQALEIVDMLMRSGAVDVIAVDSVAALTPRAELEGQMGDQTVGVQARMMSQAMRKLTGNLNRTQTLCVFTNQIREKVGVMFGSPETQPGGRALKFYASQRLDIRRIETLKDGTEAVGNRVRVKVVKNKVAAPFKQAEFDIEFGRGISTSGCLLDYGIEHNIVTKSGSFFSYGDERLGQGRGNAKAYLDEHQEVAKEIETKVYEALGIGQDLVKPIEHSDAPDANWTRIWNRRPWTRRPDQPPDDQWKAQARSRAGLASRLRVSEQARAHRGRDACAAGEGGPRAERDRGAIAELLEFGYLDDARYARVFTQDKRTLESWGNERIARTLRERGVDRDLIEAALRSRGCARRLDAGAAMTTRTRRQRARARGRAAGAAVSRPVRPSHGIASARSACWRARAMRASWPATRSGRGRAARPPDGASVPRSSVTGRAGRSQ